MTNKKATTETTTKRRRRKVRIEDTPEVQAWVKTFIASTEDAQGYIPTQDQAIQAFLAAALRALGDS